MRIHIKNKCIIVVTIFSMFSSAQARQVCDLHIVKAGETLSGFVYKKYGNPIYGSAGYLNRARALNPHIKNIDRLLPGDRICLPENKDEIPKSDQSQNSKTESSPKASSEISPETTIETKSETKHESSSETISNKSQNDHLPRDENPASIDADASPVAKNYHLGLSAGIGRYSLVYASESPVASTDYVSAKFPALAVGTWYRHNDFGLLKLDYKSLPTSVSGLAGSSRLIENEIMLTYQKSLLEVGDATLGVSGAYVRNQQGHIAYSTNQTASLETLTVSWFNLGGFASYNFHEFKFDFAPAISVASFGSINSANIKLDKQKTYSLNLGVSHKLSDFDIFASYRYRHESLDLTQTINGPSEGITATRKTHLLLIGISREW